MAVEIPVVVDIEKGFAEAAGRVPAAMAPLENSVNKLTDRLGKAFDSLNKYKIGSKNWEKAAKEIQLVSQALAVADDQFKHFSSNDGSIKQMSNDLSILARRWEEMGKKQKFTRGGGLSSDAQTIVSEYKRISAELEKSGRTLSQMIADEERMANAVQKVTQQRRYENAVLNSNGNTLHKLMEQERILTERLSRARIGSSQYDKLKTQLDGVRAAMEKARGNSDMLSASLLRQSSVVGRLIGQFSAYVSIYSLIRFAKQIRDVTGELEYQRVALGHLIQDEEYGAELFERIKAAAIESPFRIKDLVTYTKQLAAYKVEQEELFGTMMRLADVSAGLGVDMNRLILAYGQVRAASVLRGQELRQFTEAGIPLVELLAEKFTELNGRVVKTSEVFELISKRAVPFSMISEIFEDLTEKGGMFYEMQERQAATLTGRWEKLKDAFDIGLQSVGNTKTFQVYNDAILGALNLIAKNLQVLPKLIEGASAAWILYYAATTKSRIATRRAAMAQIEEATTKEAQNTANIKGIKNVNAYTYAMIRQKVATNALTRSFWKLWAAVVASPVGAAIAAVGAIAAALFLFRKRTDEATNSFHEFDALIEDTSTGLKDVARYDKLIDRYERLAKKTELTDKEHQRLYQTMSLLQEQFPEVAVGIDNETDALDVQLQKLRDLNNEREREVRERGEGELEAKRVELTGAEKKRDKMYRDRQRQQQEAARLERELALNDLYKDSNEWKNTKKRIGEINQQLAEQDKLIEGLQKRIVSLNRILHPEQVDPFTGWKKQIQEMRDLTVGKVTTPIFTDDEIEKWGTLDEALADIAKRKKVVKEREDTLTESIKGQTGEIRDQIQAELDWAQAERVRLESMEAFFTSYSSYGQDLIDNFSSLLLRSYDEGVFKRLGEEMTQMFPKSNADLLARPIIDAAKLVEKGWEEAGEGIATVYSSVYDWEDKNGVKHNIMVTPILPDGSVLSPEELDAYVEKITEDANHVDDMRLVIGVDVSDDAGEKLHQMQDDYYRLKQLQEEMSGKKPEEYLITDKELMAVKDVVDMIDLIDKKMSAIEKEIEKVSKIKLDSNISDEAKQDAEDYLRNLQSIFDMLSLLKGRYEDELSDLAKEVQGLFPNLMESAFKGMDKGTFSKLGLFSDKDLKNVTTIVDLYGLWSQKINGVTKEIENYSKKMSQSISEEQRQKILDTIQSLTDEKELLEEMGKVFGFLLKQTGGSGYQQDPWILIYKNRTKFVQDFRNSVEDLNKYLSESESLEKTRTIMEGRGGSLGFDVSEMKGSRKEVLDWYDKTIGEITAKIKKLGGRTWSGLGVQAILAKDTKSRTIKAWQDLLADVFKERTDFDLSQQKKDLENAFKKMKEELKQSETIRNFYNGLLDVTGNTELATSLTMSVYGGDVDVKSYAESVQKDLNDAFSKLIAPGDFSGLDEVMKSAFENMDFGYIFSNLDKLPEKIRESFAKMGIDKAFADAISSGDVNYIGSHLAELPEDFRQHFSEIVSDVQKYDADWVNDIIKTYQKTKTYAEREIDVRQREANKRKEIAEWEAKQILQINTELQAQLQAIENGDGTPEEKAKKRADATAAAETRKANVEKTSSETQAASQAKEEREVADIELDALKTTYEWTKAFEDMENVSTETLNSLIALLDEYIEKAGATASPEALKTVTNAKQNAETEVQSRGNSYTIAIKELRSYASALQRANKLKRDGKKNTQEYKKEMDSATKSLANAKKAVSQIGDSFNTLGDIVNSVSDILEFDELSDGRAVLSGIAAGLTLVGTALIFINAMFTLLETNPIVLAISAIIASVAALATILSNLTTAKANREIEAQQKIVKNLEKEYQALEDAIDKAFGSDYITDFNAQQEILQAKIVALNNMIAAERSKGKKTDEDKIEDWLDEIDECERKLKEMESQLSEHFSGTDVTSAARDFAQSWIDAYREFSSTTTAMKEKFKEMIDNMVVESLAGAIMKKILQPVFDEIDRLSEEGGELSEQDMAKIASMSSTAIDQANAQMTALMQNLAKYGINMRDANAGFSGLSKDIAGASEQSINGLAAGINTQNFYMSYMPTISQNVAAILAAIQGTTPASSNSQQQSTSTGFGDETFRNQMKRLDENMAELVSVLKSVRTSKTANTNTHCIATK